MESEGNREKEPEGLCDKLLAGVRSTFLRSLGFFFRVQQRLWAIGLSCLLPHGSEFDKKIAAKEAATRESQIVLKEIYGLLGILDSKASALMRYNGIILAVIALTLKSGQPLPAVGYWMVYLTIGSIMACLFVVGIFWRFLEWVDPGAPAEQSLIKELAMIERVLTLRQAAYQFAWWLSVIVSILLLLQFPEFVKTMKTTN